MKNKIFFISALVMILSGFVLANGGSTTIKVDCWHDGHCLVCGDDYGCYDGYGGWVPDCSFNDPVPSGYKVTQIEATANGVSCPNPHFNVLVNSQTIGSATMVGDCSCGNCFPTIVTGAYYGDGFPGYVYGGSNILTIDVLSGDICLANFDLKLYYEPVGSTTTTIPTTTTTIPTTTTTVPTASEFGSIAVAIAVLLASPVFAYLVVKRKR